MEKIETTLERNAKRTRTEMESDNNERNGSDDSKTGRDEC